MDGFRDEPEFVFRGRTMQGPFDNMVCKRSVHMQFNLNYEINKWCVEIFKERMQAVNVVRLA